MNLIKLLLPEILDQNANVITRIGSNINSTSESIWTLSRPFWWIRNLSFSLKALQQKCLKGVDGLLFYIFSGYFFIFFLDRFNCDWQLLFLHQYRISSSKIPTIFWNFGAKFWIAWFGGRVLQRTLPKWL